MNDKEKEELEKIENFFMACKGHYDLQQMGWKPEPVFFWLQNGNIRYRSKESRFKKKERQLWLHIDKHGNMLALCAYMSGSACDMLAEEMTAATDVLEYMKDRLMLR